MGQISVKCIAVNCIAVKCIAATSVASRLFEAGAGAHDPRRTHVRRPTRRRGRSRLLGPDPHRARHDGRVRRRSRAPARRGRWPARPVRARRVRPPGGFGVRPGEHPGVDRPRHAAGHRLGRERRPAHQGRRTRGDPRRQPGPHHQCRAGLSRPQAVAGEGLHGRGDRPAGRGQLVQRGVRGCPRTDPQGLHEPGPAQPAAAAAGDQEAGALPGHRSADPRPAGPPRLARRGARRAPHWWCRASAPTPSASCTACARTS